MPLFVCIVPVCPVRLSPSHRSEQMSQLLFGEAAELLETSEDFVKIKCLYDGYEGWCQLSQLSNIGDNAPDVENTTIVSDWAGTILVNDRPMQIPLGSSIGFLKGEVGHLIKYKFEYKGASWKPGAEAITEEMIKKTALQFLNSAYLWGGRSVFGVDCSGFCQVVFKFLGVRLLRDAYQQATQGNAIGFVQEAQCGDLAFFDNAEGKITHVGIMLDQYTIIHASGKVRIDTIDHSGIINADTGLRTHQLRLIKRMF